MVDFVEDNKSLVIFGISGVQLRLISNLRICERYALVLASNVNIGVFEIRIDRNTDLSGGIRPLFLEVVGGCYHGKFSHNPAIEEFTCQGESKGCLASTRGCYSHKVPRVRLKIFFHRLGLPGTQTDGSTPRGTIGVCRGELWLNHAVKQCRLFVLAHALLPHIFSGLPLLQYFLCTKAPAETQVINSTTVS